MAHIARLFTSESVTIGHPDKVADQISDAVLDAALSQDPTSRVACEVVLTGNTVLIGGEITSDATLDFESIARQTIIDIGYTDENIGLDGNTAEVIVRVGQQSPEIAGGVFDALEGRGDDARDPIEAQGAGDQGIIFGYAIGDNTSAFPVAGKLAHLLSARLADVRVRGEGILLPDGKTQVTIGYDECGNPHTIESILISTQHTPGTSLALLNDFVQTHVIAPVVADYNELHALDGRRVIDSGNYLINPAGEWHVGGSKSDAGLTGRKIIVDSYCGYARHGGGAFSGKDPSKTDRSAAYALRHVAKAVVQSGLSEVAEVQVAYAIGSSRPVSITVDTHGTEHIPAATIEQLIAENWDLRPGAIERDFGLRSFTRYRDTARNGHFGQTGTDERFPWENVDAAASLLRSEVVRRVA
jgi:S-adenosylmethionine synthetase